MNVVLHSAHTNGSAFRVWNRLHKLCIVAALGLDVVVVSAASLPVLFQSREIPGNSATSWGNLELQNTTEVTKSLSEVS